MHSGSTAVPFFILPAASFAAAQVSTKHRCNPVGPNPERSILHVARSLRCINYMNYMSMIATKDMENV